MWVKICGTTNLEDALLAVELGADAVGFVFAPSKRQVTAAQVARITAVLPGQVETVGVFPAWPAERIHALAAEAGLNTVQLHGGFDPALLLDLQARSNGSIQFISTLHWRVDAPGQAQKVAVQLEHLRGTGCERVLLDSSLGSAAGGTGTAFDWQEASRVFRGAGTAKLILAGGLRAENVAHAITLLRPWGVDVASGVELEPGKKSRESLASFLSRARPVAQGDERDQ